MPARPGSWSYKVGELALVYRRMVGARIRSEWQYRGAFVITTIVQLLSTSFGFATVAAVFFNVRRVAGWSFADVALMYGIGATAFSVADTFITQVETVASHVRAGTFDRFLLRPAPTMLQICAFEFAYRRLNKIVNGIVVLTIASVAVDVDWTPIRVAVMVASVVNGAVIYGSLWVIYCSVAFWTVSSSEFVYTAVTAGDIAGRYPLDVFRPTLRRGLTFVVPVAFVAYYPTCWLLGRSPAYGGDLIALGAPLVAAGLAGVASVVWSAGLHRYQGTGS